MVVKCEYGFGAGPNRSSIKRKAGGVLEMEVWIVSPF
jgi:hypothetical protein